MGPNDMRGVYLDRVDWLFLDRVSGVHTSIPSEKVTPPPPPLGNDRVITVHDGETYSSDDYDPLSGTGVVITCIDGWLQYTDRNGSSSCKNANMNGKIYVAAVTKQSRSTKGGSSTSVSSPPSSYRNGGASQGN